MDKPLADLLRPKSLTEFIGQTHLVGKDKPIRRMLETGNIKSMIFWGPPGVGKTTLAGIIAEKTDADFIFFSAVTSGVEDVRKVIKQAKETKEKKGKKTILFIDEIHRFNKSQQDAFLPVVEDGTIILIGATTENPGFRVNAPLVSRSHVYKFEALSDDDIHEVVLKATKQYPKNKFEKDAIRHIIVHSNGDARTAINAVELAASINEKVDLKVAEEALQQKAIFYDKKGDWHYDTISAFIKSMRAGNPDASLHYLARMIKAGEDPVFIARRMVIFASEDVGNASPTALVLATSCMQAVHMIGMPEAGLILAQTATYLSTCKKSIASTVGLHEAMADLDAKHLDPIPLHLRNPVNTVMKRFDYGKGHIRYPWLEKKSNKKGLSGSNQEYMPQNLIGRKYYKKDWE